MCACVPTYPTRRWIGQGYDVGDLPDDSRALMERILNDPEARYKRQAFTSPRVFRVYRESCDTNM